MSISLSTMIEGVDPSNTILFFGSGSSIPSGAPSVKKIIERIAGNFNIEPDGFLLSEIASIAETQRSRTELISCLRSMFGKISVTGSMLNLPLYW